MMKKWMMMWTALLLVALLCACTGASAVSEPKENSPVAVQLGQRVITLSEVDAKYEYMLDLYTSYGYAEPSTSRAVEALQDEVITELVNDLMLLHQADLLGIGTLSEGQDTQVRQAAEEQMESLVTIYINRAKTEGKTATRKAAIRELEATMTEAGMNMSWEEYSQYLYEELYRDRILSELKAHVTRDAEVTEDEISAYYDQTLAAQKTAYDASAGDCVDALVYFDKFTSKPVLYVPEGLLRVRILTVDSANMKAQRTIEKAYKELQSGADFADVLSAYGTDDDYTKYPVFAAEGIPLFPDAGDGTYDARVYAALGTLSPGEYSAPIILEDSCVIVNLVSGIDSGARTLKQMHDAVRAQVLTEKADALWSEQKTIWCSDLSDVVYYEDVYRGVGK